MSKYTLHAGRLIARDGAPVATLHGIRPYDPVELDDFTNEIVRTLNTAPDLLTIVKQWEAWRDLGAGAAEQPSAEDCAAAIARAEGGEHE